MNIVTRTAAALGATAALALPVGMMTAAPAHADVERQGNCGGARFDFSVDRDDDRRGVWEVSADLDNAGGPRYRLVLKQNGRIYYNQARTADREGDIEVDRDRRNTSGTDTFLLQYRNVATDQVCRSRIAVG